MNGLLEAAPEDLALLNGASQFLAQRGEYERARALLGRALALQPKDTATLLNSARIEPRPAMPRPRRRGCRAS